MANYNTDVGTAPGDSPSTYNILPNLVIIPIGVPICLENILAIIILIRSSRLIYQVRILSINLAVTDCLAGFLLSLPDAVFGNCFMKKYFTAPFINVSLITVTLFNIDRYCSLKYALRYHDIVTPKVLKIACLLSWLVGILISYLMFFDPSGHLGIFCGVMFQVPFNNVSFCAKVFLVLIIVSNLFIMSFYKRSRSVSAIPSVRTVSKLNGNCSLESVQPSRFPIQNHDINNGQSIKNQVKVMKKLTVITGFFLLCCIPYFLFQTIPNVNYSVKTIRYLFGITAGIVFLNSAVNPVFYVWRFTESRYQLKRILYCWNVEKLEKLKVERNRFFATYEMKVISPENRPLPN
jgi:hypothetical protein